MGTKILPHSPIAYFIIDCGHAERIHGIMQTEGIGKLHIAGVSLGAVLAQDFANRYPDSVNSLACFGGYDINNFDTGIQ